MQALQGSLVAIVTPLNKSGEVDYASLENLLNWHIEEGTDGIVSVGTTGESATLDVKEHIEVIDFTVKYINKRIPVIAGTGANSTHEAVELSQEAKLRGADYVLLVTPYYNKPNQKGLIKHYEKIANSVDIKQVLYNVPSRTACDMTPETVETLSKHENIVGVKEAVDNVERIRQLVNISKKCKNFSILSGDDPTFMSSLIQGAHGVISVAANVIPNPISQICKYVKADKYDEAEKLNKLYDDLYGLLFVESNPIPLKWMMYKMGLIENSIRLPLTELDETFHDTTLSELKKLKLI
ncbi:MAG: 4-hydroxy-tetrahydrodipicolinate synthase [Gammaproteobacteria bacterium]|jgi:4-hydroxy-tetrahydrodipicolinate synthase